MSDKVKVLEKVLESVQSMLDVALDMDFRVEDTAEIHKALDKFLNSDAIQNMLREMGKETVYKRAPLNVNNTTNINGIAVDNKHIWVKKVDPNDPPIISIYTDKDRAFTQVDAEMLRQSMINMIKDIVSG